MIDSALLEDKLYSIVCTVHSLQIVQFIAVPGEMCSMGEYDTMLMDTFNYATSNFVLFLLYLNTFLDLIHD